MVVCFCTTDPGRFVSGCTAGRTNSAVAVFGPCPGVGSLPDVDVDGLYLLGRRTSSGSAARLLMVVGPPLPIKKSLSPRFAWPGDPEGLARS